MNEEFRSILIGTSGLVGAGGLALFLTLAGGPVNTDRIGLASTRRAAVVALLLQAAHFIEELTTGFPERFPPLFGLTPWPMTFFLAFNLFWLAAWALSIRGLSRRSRAALFALWFLSIGCVANGIAHPLLALRAGGYFPGLLTSPFAGLAGILLFRRLFGATSRTLSLSRRYG
jgi:hypothetical protein